MEATIFRARHFATIIFSLLILAAFPISANAAVLNVPAQYATITAAVNAASAGDTVLVADGTYNAPDLTISKSITIESVNGAASTIIDCSTNNFAELEASCTIQGFTFSNADSGDLSVIFVDVSSTISHCIFMNDTNEGGNGGALELNGGTTTITGCTFDHDNGSGAISSSGASATITNCTFSNGNGQDGGGGGAINLNTGNVTITGCNFTGNTGGSSAGGVFYWRNGTLTVSDSAFTNNSASYGGVILEGAQGINSPATFTRCVFKDNSASIMGGVASLEGGSFDTTSFNAVDCTFIGNTAASDGGAIDGNTAGSSPNNVNLTNSSFYGNDVTSGSGTGVISGGATTTTKIVNSVLYGDTAPNEISTANPANSTTVSFSDIQNFTVNGVNGNVQADPKYAGPAANDLHLLNSSPCVGAGTATGAPATDFNQYMWGSTVSMGAFSPIHFDFTTPAGATQGSSFLFTVTAMAADDTTAITNFADTLHFTSSDGLGSLPTDSTLTNGTGTFNATLNTAGNQTITATDTSTTAITDTSANIDVAGLAGPATHFVVTAPSPVTSYTTNSLTVTAEDSNGNVATDYSGMVHLTSTDPGFVNATGDSTLTNGVGSFNFVLKTADAQTITAMDTVNAAITGTSNDITVLPGPTVRLIVSAPATATQGAPFNFTVTAQDLFGNTATEYAGTVHFTATDGLATLPADSTLTNGVGTLSATLNTAGNQAITATDTVTPSITGTSGTIVVASSAVLTTFPAGLQMISAPSDYSAFTVDQIFNPSGADLAVWQPLSNSYVITPTAPADTIRPGQGYWANFTTPTKLLDNGMHVDETQPFSIPLQVGWNMIGAPFAENVPLSQVRVVVNGRSQSFPTWPRLGAPVMSRLYTFPAGATEYQVDTVSLKPFTGYWLFAFKDCTLVIPAR